MYICEWGCVCVNEIHGRHSSILSRNIDIVRQYYISMHNKYKENFPASALDRKKT